MKAINLIKKVISCTPDKLSNTQRLTMSGLIFALDFKTFGGQTSRLKISCLSGLSIPTTNRNMKAFLRMGLISQQRRNKTIKTIKGDIRREIDPYIKINVERLIEYIENDQSDHINGQSDHINDQSEHSNDQSDHTNDQSEHTHDQPDTPYTDYNTVNNTDTEPSSCINEIIYGCTNENYFEFNVNANVNDGSCQLEKKIGCNDPN